MKSNLFITTEMGMGKRRMAKKTNEADLDGIAVRGT
jgi:hypothetical protein